MLVTFHITKQQKKSFGVHSIMPWSHFIEAGVQDSLSHDNYS